MTHLLFLIIFSMISISLHSMNNQLAYSTVEFSTSSPRREHNVLYRYCNTFKPSYKIADQDPVVGIEFLPALERICVTHSIGEIETYCLFSGEWICACNLPKKRRPILINDIRSNELRAFVLNNDILITENNGQIKKKIVIPEGVKISTMAFSPDNDQLILGFDNGLIGVFENEGRYQILEGHHTKITAITFSPSNKSFATGDEKGDVIFWIQSTAHLNKQSLSPC